MLMSFFEQLAGKLYSRARWKIIANDNLIFVRAVTKKQDIAFHLQYNFRHIGETIYETCNCLTNASHRKGSRLGWFNLRSNDGKCRARTCRYHPRFIYG